MCSRLRRGALYSHAESQGFTKIALGHHREDRVATFFLNLFFHAKLSSMPPKLLSDDGRHVIIRPLAYAAEADIAAHARAMAYPIIPCDLCGSQDNLQRKQVQKMMAAWEQETPGRIEQIARALGRVEPSQLADPALFDFAGLIARPETKMCIRDRTQVFHGDSVHRDRTARHRGVDRYNDRLDEYRYVTQRAPERPGPRNQGWR